MKHITIGYEATLAGRSRTAGEHDLVARLHKVNLDLLPVLHELLRTRSVTRTAQSFNMTQPAVSRMSPAPAIPQRLIGSRQWTTTHVTASAC